jgi:hypothetical protein
MLNARPLQYPEFFEPTETIFQKKHAQGYLPVAYGEKRFSITGFNQFLMAGANMMFSESIGSIQDEFSQFQPGFAVPEHFDAVASDSQSSPVKASKKVMRSFHYCYVGLLDYTMHRLGVGSPQFLAMMTELDAAVTKMVDSLRPGTQVYITADHGLIHVDLAKQIDIQKFPKLLKEIKSMAGEPRLPYLYGDPTTLIPLCQTYLSTDFEIYTKAEFLPLISPPGSTPTNSKLTELIGDVVLIPKTHATLVDSSYMSRNSMLLKGVHGGNTPTERTVPLIKFNA